MCRSIFGPVEGTVALVDRVLDSASFERRAQSRLGEIPFLVGSELVVRSGRELEARFHSEQVVEIRAEVETREDLLFDLLGRHEYVRIVLRDLLHAEESVQGPGALVPVERRGLRKAERQLAIATKRVPEKEHVTGAVHRLHAEGPGLPRRE